MYAHLPPLILASQSPRRAELLRAMGLDFSVQSILLDEAAIASEYPLAEQAGALALRKAHAVEGLLAGKTGKYLVLGADTVVLHKGRRLDKPRDQESAQAMLATLSGQRHEVISGVALVQGAQCKVLQEHTQVVFAQLDPAEIEHYVSEYRPYDKAGGYGIQEWIGLTCIARIEGSYSNVMGLPTQALHHALRGWGI